MPGSALYVAEFQRLIADKKAPDTRQFRMLISEFKGSIEFKRLADRTKADYLKHISAIELKFGDFPVQGFSDRRAKRVFSDWRSELYDASPRQSDYAWTILNRVLNVAVKRGHIERNPLYGEQRSYVAGRNDRVWTAEQEADWLKKAPEYMRLPILMAIWLGQRQTDLIKLRWEQYDGRYIRMVPSKTITTKHPQGRRLKIPVGKPLRDALNAIQNESGTILLTSDGQAWNPKGAGFRTAWSRAFDAVGGIDDELTFHDLRGTCVTRLALAGASVPQIASITGHSLRDVEAILDAHYLSRDQELADRAGSLLEDYDLVLKKRVQKSQNDNQDAMNGATDNPPISAQKRQPKTSQRQEACKRPVKRKLTPHAKTA